MPASLARMRVRAAAMPLMAASGTESAASCGARVANSMGVALTRWATAVSGWRTRRGGSGVATTAVFTRAGCATTIAWRRGGVTAIGRVTAVGAALPRASLSPPQGAQGEAHQRQQPGLPEVERPGGVGGHNPSLGGGVSATSFRSYATLKPVTVSRPGAWARKWMGTVTSSTGVNEMCRTFSVAPGGKTRCSSALVAAAGTAVSSRWSSWPAAIANVLTPTPLPLPSSQSSRSCTAPLADWLSRRPCSSSTPGWPAVTVNDCTREMGEASRFASSMPASTWRSATPVAVAGESCQPTSASSRTCSKSPLATASCVACKETLSTAAL